MLQLPMPATRSWIVSFWLACLCALAVGLVGLFAVLGGVHSALLGVLLLGGVAALGRADDFRIARRGYNAWNGLAVRYTACAGWIVVRVCYYLLLLPLARLGGSTLTLAKADSLWVDHPAAPSRFHATHIRSDESWIVNYLRWAARSGNTWAIALVPFIAFLRWTAYAAPGPRTVANIYTLY